MKEWPPSKLGPEIAIQCKHSPFCESAGPVVREGFVANRIRLLQHLEAQALAGDRSHSPIIVSPQRRVWPSESRNPTEPIGLLWSAPYESVNAKKEKPNRHSEQVALQREEGLLETPAQDYPFTSASLLHVLGKNGLECELGDLHNLCDQYTDDTNIPDEPASCSKITNLFEPHSHLVTSTKSEEGAAARSTSYRESQPSGHEITGPGPISSDLADSLTLLTCFPQDAFPGSENDLDVQHGRPCSPRRKSVAHKLDSIMERQWETCADLRKCEDGKDELQNMSAITWLQNHRADLRAPFVSGKLMKMKPPTQKSSPHPSINAKSHYHRLNRHDYSHNEGSDYTPLLYSNPPRQERLARQQRHCNTVASIIGPSSPDTGEQVLRNAAYSSIRSRSTSSLDQSQWMSRGLSKDIGLCGLTSDAATKSRHSSEHSIVSTSSTQNIASPQPIDEALMFKHKTRQESSEFHSPGFHPSSTPGTQFSGTNNRSTSWFGRSWFNAFSGDGQKVVESSLKEPLVRQPVSKSQDDAPILILDQSSRDQRSGIEKDHEVEVKTSMNSSVASFKYETSKTRDTDSCPKYFFADPSYASKIQRANELGETTLGPPTASLLSSLESKPHASPLQQLSPEYAESFSESSCISTRSRPMSIPPRRSSKRATTSPSKAASLLSFVSHDALLSPQREAFEAPQPFQSHFHKASPPVSVQMQSPDTESLVSSKSMSKSKEDLHPRSTMVDPEHRRLRRKGKVIKKIQIIISFDGADDLVIETATIKEGEMGASRERVSTGL